MFKKIQFFIALSLCSNVAMPTNPFPQPTAYHYIGVHAALAATYLAYSYTQSMLAHESVAHRYPYAQAWFEEMIAKYPDLHLDQLELLSSPTWMCQEYMAWQSLSNKIYCPQETLSAINRLYQEKLHPRKPHKLVFYEDNTRDEEIDLKIAEFLLLRQVYHWKKNTILTMPAVFATGAAIIAGTTESIACAYKNFTPNYLVLSILSGPILLCQIEYHELQADKFAYDQALDFNVANGASAYFEQDLASNMPLQLTPCIDDRIEAIKYPIKNSWNNSFNKK